MASPREPEDEPTGTEPGGGPAVETPSESDAEPRVEREYRGAGIMWGGIALVLLAATFVVVAVQNAHDVEFRFLWLTVTTPLVLVIAVTIAVALVVDEVVGFWWRRRRRTQLREREELRRLRARR